MFRQTEAQTSWLAMHPDVEVVERLVDDGISGFTGENLKHGSLGRLVAQIDAGEGDSPALVEHFSRLSRIKILIRQKTC